MYRTMVAMGLILSLQLLSSSASALERYKFQWVCHTGGSTIYSAWMDERISNVITVDDINALDCDSVSPNLRPLDRSFNRTISSSRLNMVGRRQRADSTDPNATPPWTTLTNLGVPDTVNCCSTCSASNNCNAARGFTWSAKWPDNFWMVKYLVGDDSFRRTRVTYTDGDGWIHNFYAVPSTF